MNNNERRLQRVTIVEENIGNLFTGDMVILEGLPDDATLQRTYENPARMTYNFVFQSDEFPVVEKGDGVPEAELTTAKRRVNNSEFWVCPNCHETHENGDVKQ